MSTQIKSNSIKPQKKKVLIVEDDSALNDAFYTLLKEHFSVERVYNGKDALKIAEGKKFDLILLDLLMPVMDGKEFLRQFKSSDNDKTKVIVFSNLDSQNDIQEIQELGADRYMLKSWASPKELIQIISDTLKE